MRNPVFLLLLLPVLAFSQTKKDTIWMPMKPFIGNWTGEGLGEAGKGKYERSYQFILNRNFIEVKNKASYPPTDANSKGEVHEDLGYFSYDKKAKAFKLRQFHIEGFVNEFYLDSISPDRKMFLFTTESIENIPAGYRARETYRFISDNEFEETFELAEPGKEFALYSKVVLRRVD